MSIDVSLPHYERRINQHGVANGAIPSLDDLLVYAAFGMGNRRPHHHSYAVFAQIELEYAAIDDGQPVETIADEDGGFAMDVGWRL
jgi:hypothetical protein